MRYISKQDLQAKDRIERLNIINSVSGIKPANLIGSKSSDGVSNLAIFSSVINLGSNPALMGFILRPKGDVRRHTHENITESGYYTINHVHRSIIEQAHYTAAKFDALDSEFEQCGLQEEYLEDFPAPFVKESKLKIGLKFIQEMPIKVNGTSMVIGSIECIAIDESCLAEDGHLDLSKIEGIGISGLNSYYSIAQVAKFPYARTEELPAHFSGNKH